jgi:hypothetical protein
MKNTIKTAATGGPTKEAAPLAPFKLGIGNIPSAVVPLVSPNKRRI